MLRYHANVRDKPSSGHKWPSPRNPRFESNSTSGPVVRLLGTWLERASPDRSCTRAPSKSVNPTLLPLVTELTASRSSDLRTIMSESTVCHSAPVVHFSRFHCIVLTGFSHFSGHAIDTLGRYGRLEKRYGKWEPAWLTVFPVQLEITVLAVAK